MAAAGPPNLPSVPDHTKPGQTYRSPNAPKQQSPFRAGSPNSINRSNRRHSQTSSAFSSKSPSRSSSPDSSPASSVQEAGATAEKVKEPEPDLPKAPEHFSRAFGVPKALFDMYDTYHEWHFGFAPTQNVHALVMKFNEEKERREKAEQKVRSLTQLRNSVAQPGHNIRLSEREQTSSQVDKVSSPKGLFIKRRDPRLMELIENKENMQLDDRFDKLVDYSEQVEADIDAAQDRNTLLFDGLGKAGEKISKLEAEMMDLKVDKVRLEKILEQSRNQISSGQDSPLRTEGMKAEGGIRRTTMTHADKTSTVLKNERPRPLAFRANQDTRLAELQRENDRLRQENEEMRHALEQLQNEDNCPEEPESHTNDQYPEEEQVRSTEPEVEVQGADVKMGGITTGLWKPEVNWYFSVCWLDTSR
ncbi:uncharacterized protein FFB14_11366 [Fusarium fujikuroi]|nr:uncharacterized protein FFB14_11366 [Fusarium fujikuroi]